MKTLFLHIGRHKTGTTNLQFFLDKRDAELRALGICYPRAGRADPRFVAPRDAMAHHDMALLAKAPNIERLDAMRAALIAETEPYEAVILSSEAFQNIADTRMLAMLLEGFDVSVVCYLREHLSYCASAYAQEVQTSPLAADFRTYANWFGAVLGLERFIARWNGFGSEAIWRLYDRERLTDGDVVADFLKLVGASIPAEPGDELNLSISGNLLAFKQAVNTYGLHQKHHAHALGFLASQNADFRGPFYIPAIDEMELRRGNSCNAVLEQMFGSIPLKSFREGPIVFGPSYQDDFERILRTPAFEEMGLEPAFRGFLRC